MTPFYGCYTKDKVADLIELHGRRLVRRVALRDMVMSEWGMEIPCPSFTAEESMLDYLVAESVGMVFDVKDGRVEAFWCEEDNASYIFAVPFRPSRDIGDALWASRIAAHGFDNSVTDPLDVCASILGRL